MKLLAREKRQVATGIRNRTPTEQAVAALQRVSADPVLLGVAAGRRQRTMDGHPTFHSIGREVAELLVEARADSRVCAMTASSVERRLRRQMRRG